MSKFAGSDYIIGIAEESTRGTAVDPSTGDYIKATSVSVKDQPKTKEIEQSLGRNFYPQDVKVVGWDSSISFSFYLDRKMIKHVLKGFFGTITTSADTPEAGVNTHDFDILNSNVQYPSYTLTLIKGDIIQHQYVLGTISKVTISFKTEDLPLVTVEMLGNKYSEVSGKTASFYTDDNIFNSTQTSIYWATSYAGLDSATATCVQEAEITLEKGVEGIQCLGSDTYGDIVTLETKASAKIVKIYEDTDLENVFKNWSSISARIKAVDSDVTLGTSTNPVVQIDLPNVKVTERSESVDLKKLVGEELTLTAMDDLTNGGVKAELITDV